MSAEGDDPELAIAFGGSRSRFGGLGFQPLGSDQGQRAQRQREERAAWDFQVARELGCFHDSNVVGG